MLYRIGIDVGGTFTHAVALSGNRLIGKIKVPTTHHSPLGVGDGVVASLVQLMKESGINADEISLVAHSTTQATNSLLEGDVEKVGIISLGTGIAGKLTRRACRLGLIPLAPGKYLETLSHHINEKNREIDSFLDRCKLEQIKVLVIASAFSIENPEQENAVADYVRKKGFWATCTHEVSQLYGVRVRTRTTAINASILPKMLEVADHTEREIRKLGITCPLMIMRSDGGIMTIEEMRKKPILTLLSGPAAGIAAALRYLKITDGIFIEVGGTSTDISVIKEGRAIIRTATIGGNRTFLKTLDCRTLGVGGGSIPRMSGDQVIGVGPRSAHIARVKYAAFEESGETALQPKSICPRPGDPEDYLIFTDSAGNQRVGFTPTCAANLLGYVPEGDCARASLDFSRHWSKQRPLAESILERTSEKVSHVVEALIREYKMERGWTKLVGGGGGASAIVPHLAEKMGLSFEIAQDHDVISAIGVALGLIREVIERSCINPTSEDIQRLREEARHQVLKQGASPESVEVFIEIDAKKNLIRAEAQGAIEFKKESQVSNLVTPEEVCREVQVGFSLAELPRYLERAESRGLVAHRLEALSNARLPWFRKRYFPVVVTDSRGVFRLKLRDATCVATTVSSLSADLMKHLEFYTEYDDGGVSLPYVYALIGERIVDLSKLHLAGQMRTVLEMEAAENPQSDPSALLFTRVVTNVDE